MENQDFNHYSKLIVDYAKSSYKKMFREKGGILKHNFIVPGACYHQELWDWDSWLTNIALNKIVEEDIFKYMQNFFNRPLSPLEYDVIQVWKSKKYDFALIKASCEIAAQTGNKSIRYIDTIIFEENKKLELGVEEYQRNQQETIELSKVDWLNK